MPATSSQGKHFVCSSEYRCFCRCKNLPYTTFPPRGSCKCVCSSALLRLSLSSSCPWKRDELSAFKQRVSWTSICKNLHRRRGSRQIRLLSPPSSSSAVQHPRQVFFGGSGTNNPGGPLTTQRGNVTGLETNSPSPKWDQNRWIFLQTYTLNFYKSRDSVTFTFIAVILQSFLHNLVPFLIFFTVSHSSAVEIHYIYILLTLLCMYD